jgi:hypothetical protein
METIMTRFGLATSFAFLIAFSGAQAWSQTPQPSGGQMSAGHHRVVHTRRYVEVYDPNDPSEDLNKQELQRLGLPPAPELLPAKCFYTHDWLLKCYVF